MSSGAMQILCDHDYRSGNVRELRNALRAMTENHIGGLLTPLAIPRRLIDSTSEANRDGMASPLASASLPPGLSLCWEGSELPSYDRMADLLLVAMVRQHKAQSAHATLPLRDLAQKLSISRSTLSSRLKGMVDQGHMALEDIQRLVNIKS